MSVVERWSLGKLLSPPAPPHAHPGILASPVEPWAMERLMADGEDAGDRAARASLPKRPRPRIQFTIQSTRMLLRCPEVPSLLRSIGLFQCPRLSSRMSP